jgi:hypothetical protein
LCEGHDVLQVCECDCCASKGQHNTQLPCATAQLQNPEALPRPQGLTAQQVPASGK